MANRWFTGHPALLRMWVKRQRGYRAMGYRIAEPTINSAPAQMRQGCLAAN